MRENNGKFMPDSVMPISGNENTATYDGTEVKHELNGDLYPILGTSYAF